MVANTEVSGGTWYMNLLDSILAFKRDPVNIYQMARRRRETGKLFSCAPAIVDGQWIWNNRTGTCPSKWRR
jgi:hypothetical protein